ncbi:MAG: TIGR02996 domain-containing protein [Labilithrix sp.]
MTDALIAAILAHPDDDAPRLVWADREGGERGELVVVQCALAAEPPLPRAERDRLRARERELLAKLEKVPPRTRPVRLRSSSRMIV